MKRRSRQRWPLRQALRYRRLPQVLVWPPHLLLSLRRQVQRLLRRL
jgi:hypothetical protein